jgi:hypothetical protein
MTIPHPYTPPRPTQALGRSTGSAAEPPADQRVATARAEERRDRVRWGPIWAGVHTLRELHALPEAVFRCLTDVERVVADANSAALRPRTC